MRDNVNKMYIVYKHVQDSTKSASLKPTVKPTASKALNPDYKLIVHFVHLSFIPSSSPNTRSRKEQTPVTVCNVCKC